MGLDAIHATTIGDTIVDMTEEVTEGATEGATEEATEEATIAMTTESTTINHTGDSPSLLAVITLDPQLMVFIYWNKTTTSSEYFVFSQTPLSFTVLQRWCVQVSVKIPVLFAS